MSTPRYAVIADWLVQEVDRCTCDGLHDTYGHRPECGYEPLVRLRDIQPALVAAGYEAAWYKDVSAGDQQ